MTEQLTHTHAQPNWCEIVSHYGFDLHFPNIAHQAPLSMECSRQEYWSGLPCSPPRDLPDPGIEPPMSLVSPALAGGFFTTAPPNQVYKSSELQFLSL